MKMKLIVKICQFLLEFKGTKSKIRCKGQKCKLVKEEWLYG